MTSSSSSGSWLSTSSPCSAAATTTAKACCACGQVKSWLVCRAPAPSSVRRASSSQQRPHGSVNSSAVVDEQPRALVGDRLAGAAGGAVGDGRGRVHAGLADDQAPALLQRGQQQQPGALVDLVLALLVDLALEHDRVPGAVRRGVGVQLALPPAAAHDVQPQAGELSRSASDGVDGVLDLLVRDQPADHRDRRVRGLAGVDVHHRVGAVVHDRDPRPADAEAAELGAGGARDRDVLAVPVEPRREAALDPPAHLGHCARCRRPATARGGRGAPARSPAPWSPGERRRAARSGRRRRGRRCRTGRAASHSIPRP